MRRIRDRLKELDFKLYESLLRSHDIAWNEWLPALSVQLDSYNSFPHIRNLENYLDNIVASYEESRKKDFFISAAEMYIMLASILFHDIGKIGNSVNHAAESRRILCGMSIFDTDDDRKSNKNKPNYKVWASLGIPSHELAMSIGRICEYHDIDKIDNEEMLKKLKNNLSSIFIEAYGEVRQRSLASLLVLVDHLDSAHTRILPYYLKGSGEIKVVGAFRRVITGVYFDLKTNMVTTVLNEELPDGEESVVRFLLNLKPEKDEVRNITRILKDLKDTVFVVDEAKMKHFNWVKDNLPIYLSEAAAGYNKEKFLECLEKMAPKTEFIEKWVEKSKACFDGDYSYIEDFFSEKTIKAKPQPVDSFLVRDLLRAEIVSPDPGKVWPQYILQDLILGNVITNNKALQLISAELESLEIPVSAWLIEHKEHLYNCCGKETFEPVFSKNFLYEAAVKMWELSTQIFGVTYFSYENLASIMREPDLQKVKAAVRRISIMTSGSLRKNIEGLEKDDMQSTIMSGDTNWKWIVDNNDKPCHFIALKDVRKMIEKAGEPNG